MRAAALAALLALATAASPATPDRPVRIGAAGPDLDACLSQSEVTGLNPRGDNFLTVRAGPGRDARDIGWLGPGHIVTICEEHEGWLGIVFGPAGRVDEDCGVGSPVPSPRAYDGPCHSGWVAARYVRVVAG
jgi:Bacterial SH3 domain